jgi:hypothetical protein
MKDGGYMVVWHVEPPAIEYRDNSPMERHEPPLYSSAGSYPPELGIVDVLAVVLGLLAGAVLLAACGMLVAAVLG